MGQKTGTMKQKTGTMKQKTGTMNSASMLIKEIENGALLDRFEELYLHPNQIKLQPNRYLAALRNYIDIFCDTPVAVFSSPGRTEICGNHTDHQRGSVLAASVNLDTIAVAAPRTDGMIRIQSDGYEWLEMDNATTEYREEEKESSGALVRGVLKYYQLHNFATGGFDAYITSDVLKGSGMSSSASFEVLIGFILSSFYNDSAIDPIVIAQAGQFAENEYFGKPCGLMDQTACAVGDCVYIDFNNPKEPICEKIPYKLGTGYSLCITDTGGTHADLTDEYASIPREMRSVASCLGHDVLRDCSVDDLCNNLKHIRKEAGDRAVVRAFHFFNEQKNVLAAANALRSGQAEQFFEALAQSGRSSQSCLQNIYPSGETQNQSIELALALTEELLDQHGTVRVHGGGFAGTILAFVPNGLVSHYKDVMDSLFRTGACYVLLIRPMGVVRVV